MRMWRLLLVDDHALFREGLAGLLAYQEDFKVVGEAENAEAAVAETRRLRPDVVLMDIDLPGEDGVSATRRIKAAVPEAVVVMLTAYDDTDRLLDALKAGAQGYLLKNIRSSELLDQLRGLAAGEAPISRRIATRMLDEFGRGRDSESAQPEEDLTPRELEVLELVAARLQNKQIAERLVISEHTVKNHLKNILAKLHLRSRRQAAAYGVARGWVRPREG
jgi:DNA-binding NarL/FixJ family response regulator